MGADRIRVTVDGEPVTREVSWEQVRAYLRAKGWVSRDDTQPYEWWWRGSDERSPQWGVQINAGGAWGLRQAIERIAEREGRHPSAVLRDIARGTEPSGVEPLTEAELAALDRSDEEWQRTASGFDAVTVRRLLATVRAREAEIDRLRRLFGPIVNSATMLANARDTGEHEAQRVRHELLMRKIHEP